MKITNKKPIGNQQVYDIGCENHHNFVVKTSNTLVVAHNCFNASHSVAYSYTSWITAYLKANYPADFIAALLSCDSSNLDEIKKSISAAKDIGVSVIPPDINESSFDFTRIDNKKIRFGLSAIKGLGEQVVEQIIQERLVGGKFADFPDLIKRVQLTKRATDGLIYSGALDSFGSNRNQLIKDAELLLDWAKDLLKNKNSGQMSLFDISSSVSLSPPKAPLVDDFDFEERNAKEAEFLGICLNNKFDFNDINLVSGFCDENIESIQCLNNDKNAVFIARVTNIRSTTIKNGAQQGKMMAFLKLSDNSGDIEAVMFPNAYDLYGLKLRTDCSFLINGVVSQKDGDKQVIVNNICDPNDVNFVVVYVDDDEIDKHTIRTAISFSRGEMPLILWYRGQIIRAGKWVSDDAIENLTNLGISAAKTSSQDIKDYLGIFDCVDMLRNAQDWETITELSTCFSMVSDDYGKTVWNYAPKTVRNHVNNLKKTAPLAVAASK